MEIWNADHIWEFYTNNGNKMHSFELESDNCDDLENKFNDWYKNWDKNWWPWYNCAEFINDFLYSTGVTPDNPHAHNPFAMNFFLWSEYTQNGGLGLVHSVTPN